MRKTLIVCAATVALALGFTPTALASPLHHHGRGHTYHQHDSWSSDESDDSGDDSPDTEQPDTVTPSADTSSSQAAAAGGTVRSGAAQTIQVETTSYNNADNQGGNNATICCGVLHKTASGDGSFKNPITLAVPGSGGSGMQTPAGTRVYFVKYRFYGLVEDSGASPKSLRRFDIWSDGRGLSTSAGSDCMDRLTGTSSAILNPPANEPVAHVGPLADASGCHV